MESRLGRLIGAITGIHEEEPPKVDLSDLRWGKRVLASEIGDPEVIEEIFQTEPVLGQTTLPFDGTVDMEIYQPRTMNHAIVERMSRPTEQDMSEDQLRLKEFVGA
jgi:hypothetical protein